MQTGKSVENKARSQKSQRSAVFESDKNDGPEIDRSVSLPQPKLPEKGDSTTPASRKTTDHLNTQ